MGLTLNCHNREPYLDEIEVEVALHADGRPIKQVYVNRMSKSCQYDLRLLEPGCQGCKWQKERDPRDGPEVQWMAPIPAPPVNLVRV